jgi:hypothetical protein
MDDIKAEIHAFRKEIDALVVKSTALIEKVPTGKGEATLSMRNLQLAKMWQGKVLEEMGSELPAEFADKA